MDYILEIGVAFAWLILAGLTLTIAVISRSRGLQITLLSLGSFFLLLQGGCCILLTQLDKGLGGSGDSIINTVSMAGAIGFIIIAVYIMAKRKK